MTAVFNTGLCEKAQAILDACKKHDTRIATVESCTGGLLSAILTELPGSSRMFTHGFITYANHAKSEMVGVDEILIDSYGAVSEQVARAMAEGALECASIDLAVAITGIAGPDGGSEHKPVGTVHFACAMRGKPTIHQHKIFAGDRSEVRLAAVDCALDMIVAELKK
jgi:nicotinamide-nucleotide amidase